MPNLDITFVSGGYDSYMVKYSRSGGPLWAALGAQASGNVFYTSAKLDTSGNIYIVGYYTASLNVYNADGSQFGSLTNAGSGDVCLIKYNTTGQVQWAARIAGTSSESTVLWSIGTDNSNNVTVAFGYSSSPVTIYNADGSSFGTLSNAGGSDIGIAKYNSSGVVQWTARVAGGGNEGTPACYVDTSGNVYVGCDYGQLAAATIYNSNGSAYQTLPAYGSYNQAFVAKYNASGTAQWAGTLKGSSAGVTSISADTSGNVYISGVFDATLTIYNANLSAFGTLPNAGGTHNQLIKYNSTGAVQWATRIAGGGNDYMNNTTIDGSGNVYLSGAYGQLAAASIYNSDGTVFSTLPAYGNFKEAALVKYNSAGFAQWAVTFSGTGNPSAVGIATDASNNVYCCGACASNVVIYKADGSVYTTLTTPSSLGFVIKYNSNGVPLSSAKVTGATGSNFLRNVNIDSDGNMFMIGWLNANATCYVVT